MVKIFSVFDKKSRYYGPLMVYRSEADSKRAVSQALSRGGSLLSDFPEDYSLYCFGDFDDSTGKFSLLEVPLFICDLVDLQVNTDVVSE